MSIEKYLVMKIWRMKMDPARKELRKIKNKCRDEIITYTGQKDYCLWCSEKSSYKMTIHHRFYIKDDVIYKNYRNSIYGRIEYYNDLLPLIKDNPSRFLYVCIKCHNILEYYLQFGKNLECEIVKELNKEWSDFQYMFNNRCSIIAKFALRELKLDDNRELHKKIDRRPYQDFPKHKNMITPITTGLDGFFWS